MMPDVIDWSLAWPYLLAALVGGYFCGSVVFGPLVARAFGLGDLRQIGSGNVGATNVLRTGNKKAAALTLILDALKAVVPVAIAASWGPLAASAAALGAFIGHVWPIWLRFQGGKGVATGFGAILALEWQVGLLCAAVWLAVVVLTRRSSAGALATAVAAPALMAWRNEWEFFWVVLVMAVILLAKHRANIGRLLAGTEPRIGQ